MIENGQRFAAWLHSPLQSFQSRAVKELCGRAPAQKNKSKPVFLALSEISSVTMRSTCRLCFKFTPEGSLPCDLLRFSAPTAGCARLFSFVCWVVRRLAHSCSRPTSLFCRRVPCFTFCGSCHSVRSSAFRTRAALRALRFGQMDSVRTLDRCDGLWGSQWLCAGRMAWKVNKVA